MKSNNFLYNNEGIGLVALISVLRETKKLEYSKAFLIFPFLLNNDIVKYLKRRNANVLGISSLISNQIVVFSNFNAIYYSFYPLTLNVIAIAEELQLISISQNFIEYIEPNKFEINSSELGNRAESIVSASKPLADLLQQSSQQLYFSLRIKL